MTDEGSTLSGPTLWERRGLWLLLLVLVLFGVAVQYRSVFLQRRMGDLGVYLRAAWAAQHGGEQLYQVTCNNGWHYCYPPLLAILLIPLADSPPGSQPTGIIPYAATVGLWYIFSVFCLAAALHWLARALETTSTDPTVRRQPVGSRRWWMLRILPLLICLPPIGHSLMRGQVNLLLLALICGFISALIQRRQVWAGVCLAGAICLKIFPVLLLLVPLWRHERRCLASCGIGLVVGLGLIPLAAFGPAQSFRSHVELYEVLLGPALGVGSDQSRAKELIEVTATDSQAFLAIIHNTLYLDRSTRPCVASPTVRCLHWVLGGCMTLLTLWVFRARCGKQATGQRSERVNLTLFVGALVLNMLLLSPVCHLHYFALCVPLVMALLTMTWERNGFPRGGVGPRVLFLVFLVANILPLLPGFELMRDAGLAGYAVLLLWGASLLAGRGLARNPQSGQRMEHGHKHDKNPLNLICLVPKRVLQ